MGEACGQLEAQLAVTSILPSKRRRTISRMQHYCSQPHRVAPDFCETQHPLKKLIIYAIVQHKVIFRYRSGITTHSSWPSSCECQPHGIEEEYVFTKNSGQGVPSACTQSLSFPFHSLQENLLPCGLLDEDMLRANGDFLISSAAHPSSFVNAWSDKGSWWEDITICVEYSKRMASMKILLL